MMSRWGEVEERAPQPSIRTMATDWDKEELARRANMHDGHSGGFFEKDQVGSYGSGGDYLEAWAESETPHLQPKLRIFFFCKHNLPK